MTATQNPPNETQATKPKPITLGEFNGAFGKFQLSAFGDLKRAGFSAEISHKVALDFGSSIGDAMRNGDDESFRNKVGKAKKDGEASIRISASGMTRTSKAMSLLRVVQTIEGLNKEELLNTRKVDIKTLSEGKNSLQEYLAESGKWASEQVWAE